MIDPEIEAISKCHELFLSLKDDSKVRVIQWLISKFQLNTSHAIHSKQEQQRTSVSDDVPIKVLPNGNGKNGDSTDRNSDVKGIGDFDSVAEFFAATTPNTDWEKGLVVATYLQIKNEMSDFTGFQVNKELKNLGHGMANITSTFDVCIEKKPQLILQLRKEGKSRQAQKKYKVSAEGIKYVKTLLGKNNEN